MGRGGASRLSWLVFYVGWDVEIPYDSYTITFSDDSPNEKTPGEFDEYFEELASDKYFRPVQTDSIEEAYAIAVEAEKRNFALTVKGKIVLELRPPFRRTRKITE